MYMQRKEHGLLPNAIYLFIAEELPATVHKQTGTCFKVTLSTMVSTLGHTVITKHKNNGVIIQLFKYQPTKYIYNVT